MSRVRLVGPDVTRALALIGALVMNYHGYLNYLAASSLPGDGWAAQLFDPWQGPLSTRFAATFVLVAGVGVSLITRSAVASESRSDRREMRWRLIRRGVLLYAVGFVLDWIWPGTILFFYGAFFIAAAFLFHLRTRWLVVIGSASALAAAGIHWWVVARQQDGHDTTWLDYPGTLISRSPRGLLLDTVVNGTHPLFPWLAFLCAGMILGRSLPHLRYLPVALAGATLTATTYLINHLATNGQRDNAVLVTVLSTQPFDRSLLYTLNALGSAIAAFCLISWVAERFPTNPVTVTLANAGQMTLTLYVLHIITFNAVVNWWGWVEPTGLDTALVFAATFWVIAISSAAVWVRFVGMGPLERIYRRFGG